MEELQMLPSESNSYLNKVTGKVVMLTDDIVAMAEIGDEIEEELEDVKEGSESEAPDLETAFYQEVMNRPEPGA